MKIVAISRAASAYPILVYKTDEPLTPELLKAFRNELSGHSHLPKNWSIEGGLLKTDLTDVGSPTARDIEDLNAALKKAAESIERHQQEVGDDRNAFLEGLSHKTGLPLVMW